MHESNGYTLAVQREEHLLAEAGRVFDLVWRVDFTTPGFCMIDAGPTIDSRTLRSWMISLKKRLSEIAIARDFQSFTYLSMARFDQQVTTKFHLDGAPNQSMLMLGYEPSKVRSRLFLADYSLAAFDLGMAPQQILQDFNPMYRRGEEMLTPYVTELPRPTEGHSQILIINNSSLPFTEQRVNALGVMHKAEMIDPDDSKTRVVNSTMIGVGEADEISLDQQREFVTTQVISKK